uniref:Uncharacterized protein n=1 Tax=Rhizophora mucronata TaxID=61149 RepID=A0A2P2QJP8_RHIMU
MTPRQIPQGQERIRKILRARLINDRTKRINKFDRNIG